MRNRFASSTEPTDRLDKLRESTYSSVLTDPSYLEQQVCLFGPERYEPRYQYPLVVWLHSCHSAERELESVMPELSLQNYVACAPRGTVACDPCGKRFRWGKSPAATAIAEEVVFDAIAQASGQFSVAPERIFLAGFGGGASMAWRLALRYPGRFAGVVAICGEFPSHDQPLSNIENARELPTLWMYGADSTNCGVQQVCDALPVMHSASLSVDIRQYPCGNELLSNMLSDMNGWLMERVTSQPANLETVAEESFSRN
ncbi:MAG: hypothetical protein KDA45_04530 [Planctomycetales bacterium]|nr:hypothetical protein [Planctomycetales bacterium]